MFLAQIEAQSRQGRGPAILGLLDTAHFNCLSCSPASLLLRLTFGFGLMNISAVLLNLDFDLFHAFSVTTCLMWLCSLSHYWMVKRCSQSMPLTTGWSSDLLDQFLISPQIH